MRRPQNIPLTRKRIASSLAAGCLLLPLLYSKAQSQGGANEGQEQAPSPSAVAAARPGNLLQEKVNLEYRNAPLLDVIRSIADTAKINVALSSQVIQANSIVTIRLSNVTYDVALKTILDLYRLSAVVENGILRIDTLDNLSRERQLKTQAKEDLWRSEPTRVMVWQVNYAKAKELVTILTTMLKGYASDRRLSIQADDRTNKIIVEGVADALTRAKTLLENLDRRKNQVLIEARIVEASSELSKTLSVTWGTRFGVDGQRGLSSGIVFPNSIVGNIGGAGALGQTAPSPGQGSGPTQLGTFGFTLGSINSMINIDGVLRAYETESLANVVASPRIVVQDQEEATIEESNETTRFVLRNNNTETQTTSARMRLNVTPQITSDNTLELKIDVDRDTPTNAPTDPVQGFTRRSAKTRLLVNNGDTAVIGGLYQMQKFKGQGRIPVLGRLPIIGFLFRTNDELSKRTELMVLITPRILPSNFANEGGTLGSGASGVPDIPNNMDQGAGDAAAANVPAAAQPANNGAANAAGNETE